MSHPFCTPAFVATLLAAIMLALPASAANPDCAVFGEIAQKAAVERQADAEMMDAMVRIAEEYTGAQERFVGAVPLLVDWVYALPDDQLGKDVGAAYKAACEAQ